MAGFLDEFVKAQSDSKTEGIPGFEMNRPLVDKTTKGSIGLELELEGINLINAGHLDGVLGKITNSSWDVKQDGSLRGGLEYVLSRPCEKEELETLVNGLFNRFEGARVRLNNSNRCSTHVHVNVQGLKINQITSIIVLWKIFENYLIRWNGIERVKNHFCLSSDDEVSFVENWVSFLRNGIVPSNRGSKYSALNVLTIWNFGSLEFRCGRGADNPEYVITWAKFLKTFVDYAVENYPNPSQIAYDLSERGAATIFEDICSKDASLSTFRNEIFAIDEDNFNTNCMVSFRNVQNIVLGFPWNDWISLVEKEYVPNPFLKTKKKFVT